MDFVRPPPQQFFLFFYMFNLKNVADFSDYCFIAGFTGLMVRVGKELQLYLLDKYVVAGPNRIEIKQSLK